MKETRIVLTESHFTFLCKYGFFIHKTEYGKTDLSMTKIDIKDLATGKIVEKEVDDGVVKLALQDIGTEMIKEIIKRTPLYSDIVDEL